MTTLNPDDAAEPVDPYAPDDDGQDDTEPERRDTGDELTNDGTDDGDDTDTTTG